MGAIQCGSGPQSLYIDIIWYHLISECYPGKQPTPHVRVLAWWQTHLFIHSIQHMNGLKHHINVWSGCRNHSMWVRDLNHCTLTSFVISLWPSQAAISPKNSAGTSTWYWHDGSHICSCTAYSIWLVSNTLYMYVVDVGTIPCGSGASIIAHWHHL